MEPDYDFEAKLQDIGNSLEMVVYELQNSGRREPDYIEGFSRTIINLNIQLLLARGFTRQQIIDLHTDEASA
jgi:hypothetical protein